jgi:hypothetical protein
MVFFDLRQYCMLAFLLDRRGAVSNYRKTKQYEIRRLVCPDTLNGIPSNAKKARQMRHGERCSPS